jgi:two-component system, sensor histidine kinase LadS
MIRKFLFIFFALQLFVFAKAQSVDANVSYYILEDPSLQLTPEKAVERFRNKDFTFQKSNQYNPGFTKSVYWLAVTVDSSANADSIRLIIGQPVINKIDFYSIDEHFKPVFLYQTGDHYPFKQRPYLTVDYSFPLSKRSNVYLLRIDKHNESLQLTFNTLTATTFIQSEIDHSVITATLTGIIILLLIFGLYLSVISGKRIYIFYILYIASGWLWVLSDLGYGFKYLWPDNTWFANRSRPVFSNLTIGFSLQYLIYYLGSIRTKLLRKLLKAISYFGLFIVAVWLLPLNVYNAAQLSWFLLLSIPITAAAHSIVTIITLVVEARNKNVMAIFYLSALVPLFLLIFIYILNHSGLINISGSFIEQYGVASGYVIEAIILTFGLVYRFNSYRLEKEKLHIAYERQQKENAKALIDTESKERRKIADELHDIAGSSLSAAKLNITSLRENYPLPIGARNKLDNAEEALNVVSGSIRNLSHALSPIMLDTVGLKKAIQNIVTFFNSSGKIKIETIMIGFDEYDPQLENIYIALYGIIYELLNNIAKHAKATNAIIQLIEHKENISLIVEDNGIGIKNESDTMNSKGLSGIISKINYFNGSIAFDQTEQGLIISIEIPIQIYESKDSFG